MDKETYEKQKAFAGEKIPSMHRRMVGHDYQERQMYMITMVTEGRKPLLGQVVGKSEDVPKDVFSSLLLGSITMSASPSAVTSASR